MLTSRDLKRAHERFRVREQQRRWREQQRVECGGDRSLLRERLSPHLYGPGFVSAPNVEQYVEWVMSSYAVTRRDASSLWFAWGLGPTDIDDGHGRLIEDPDAQPARNVERSAERSTGRYYAGLGTGLSEEKRRQRRLEDGRVYKPHLASRGLRWMAHVARLAGYDVRHGDGPSFDLLTRGDVRFSGGMWSCVRWMKEQGHVIDRFPIGADTEVAA